MDFVGTPMKKILYICALLPLPLGAFNFFSSTPQTPEEKIAYYQRQQIDYPNDPDINYNLGVATYLAGKFDDAKASFNRTLEHCAKNKILKKQALFNLGNACLKQSLNNLPGNWEQEENIDSSLLDTAINGVKEAIDTYQKFIDVEPEHMKGSTNKRYAEEILKKLEEKKKQQQQQHDKNDQSQQNQQQQQDNQQKNNQQQSSQQQNQQQQGQSQGNQQEKNDQKDDQQGQNESGSKQPAEQSGNQRPQGGNDKFDTKEGEKKDQDNMPHDQSHEQKQPQQQPQSQGTQESQEKQAIEQAGAIASEQKETAEMRRMRALLENLQSDESQQQKQLLMRKAKQQEQAPSYGQKSW
jgi:hypothetical protein